MENLPIQINHQSSLPKYIQIVNHVSDAIDSGSLKPGEALPSVNDLIRGQGLSRDTIFKAYRELARKGLVNSIPGKGYFVAKTTVKVMLFLDRYSPFKEGLYSSLRDNLPANYQVDLYFHHYNYEVIDNVTTSTSGRYQWYVIMSPGLPGAEIMLKNLNTKKILIIDLLHGTPSNLPAIYQDFQEEFQRCLEKATRRIKAYDKVYFVIPPENHHPKESIIAFNDFCIKHSINGKVVESMQAEYVKKSTAFIVVSDDDLVMIVEEAQAKNLKIGKSIGVVSYNDTPVKKIIAGGITVISTDFRKMGEEAALAMASGKYVRKNIPTRLILRNSL